VKQLGFACCQVVQKPVALSFHIPVFLEPDSARGSRVILPSDVNVILNLVPPGVEAVKDWPLKKVALMSLGAIGSAAKAALPVRSMDKTGNAPTHIKSLSQNRLIQCAAMPVMQNSSMITLARHCSQCAECCFALQRDVVAFFQILHIPIADRPHASFAMVQDRPIEGGLHILSARKSAYVRDPLLGRRFSCSNRLSRQLEHRRFLTLKHVGEDQSLPVRKF
jgi:hypothetical protein